MSRYYDDFSDIDTDGNELEHYGVPGMKWGVRKQRYTSMTPGSAMHYGRKAAGTVSKAKRTVASNTRSTDRKVIKGTLHEVHNVGKAFRMTGQRVNKALGNMHKEARASQKQATKKGIEITRKHLTASGKIKVNALAQDTKTLGEQFVKLRGRNAA